MKIPTPRSAASARRDPTAAPHHAASAFASRNYRIYVAGNSVSLIGSWLQRVAVGWLAWQLTHSGVWLGLVSFADLFPTVLLSFWAGAIADRRDRISLIAITQWVSMGQSLLLAILTWTGFVTVEALFALTCVLGCATALAQPARLALVPSLVDRKSLPSAVAINSTIFNAARFVGPAAAGFIIAEGGVALAFAINSLSFFAFLVSLARLDIPRGAPVAPAGNLLSASIDGYRYALRHGGIGSLLLLMAATSVGMRGFVELMPGFADAVFGRGAQGLAWLTATIGLGAVVGGVWMARRPGLGGLTSLVIGSTLVLSAAVLGFTATTNYWIAIACVFVAGFSLVVSGIGTQTLVQTAVEPGMRGRVMSIYGMIFRGGPALGALAMGALSGRFGLRAPLAAGAVLCALVWLWARLRRDGIASQLEGAD